MSSAYLIAGAFVSGFFVRDVDSLSAWLRTRRSAAALPVVAAAAAVLWPLALLCWWPEDGLHIQTRRFVLVLLPPFWRTQVVGFRRYLPEEIRYQWLTWGLGCGLFLVHRRRERAS